MTGCGSPGTVRRSSTFRRGPWRTRARCTSGRVARPESQDALNADRSTGLPRPATGDELRATLLALLGSPHLCSRAFITEQYDRYVRGNTVLAEHADGGVLRVDEATGRGIAMSTDASGRYTLLDPYTGAQLALAEAYRNVAVTGATPVAVTNCLNFGSPEDPGVMWQFSQASAVWRTAVRHWAFR